MRGFVGLAYSTSDCNSGASYVQIIDAVKAQYVDSDVESKIDEIIDTLIRIGLIREKEG